ncbi:Ku protein [Streptomyces sp. NPDC055134]
MGAAGWAAGAADRSGPGASAACDQARCGGVCKVAIRSRERIALLWPRHGMLILQTLLWQDELRDPGGLAPCAPVTEGELELARY